MFQQDWILRQIEMIGIVLARLLFGKDKPDYEIVEKEKLSDSDQLYIELIRMLDEGKINEAENRLYEELDSSRLHMLELALAFYSRLNQFDDAYLEAFAVCDEILWYTVYMVVSQICLSGKQGRLS